MFSKTSILIGFGAGYVLGARAGRERYDQIMTQVRGVAENPAVQEKAGVLQQQATEVASKAKDSATEAAGKAKSKASNAKSSSSDDTETLSSVGTSAYTPSPTSGSGVGASAGTGTAGSTGYSASGVAPDLVDDPRV